ncbi:SPT16 protein, partial [Urocolius indicus]|nr:SPT16 protein [Urocolius indicus]
YTTESNVAFQKDFINMYGKKTPWKRSSRKKSNVAASKWSDTPDALQEVKNHLGNGEAESKLKTTKMVEIEENNLDRASHKHKLENNEELAVKEETASETGSGLIPTALSLLPQQNLMDLEEELVYVDDENILLEFDETILSSSTHSACCDPENAGALMTLDGRASPLVDKQLQIILQKANTCYRQEKYQAAVEKLSAALELCSEGAATNNPTESSPEDISSINSFIETKLVTCYLKLRKFDEALNHSYRSIILNPSYFRNHLRQAAVFRCLERYSEAARSAMIADYIYWLTEGTEQHTSKLIKLYWQAMIEEAITTEVSFSVMYTPFVKEVKADEINKIKDVFAQKHPDYVEYIYTDPHGFHILPQTTEWPSLSPQKYLLTLGFRSKPIGKILERWSSKKLPIFSERTTPYSPLSDKEANTFWDNTGKKIMPVMDFIRSTKLTDNLCPCSRGIEKLHYASLLDHLQRGKEWSQAMNQAIAELATLPYLQDLSENDDELVR